MAWKPILMSDRLTVLLQVLDRTIKVDYRIPSKPKVSQAAIDFIDKLLQGDPANRLTIQGVYAHPWFKHGFPASVSFFFEHCFKRRLVGIWCDFWHLQERTASKKLLLSFKNKLLTMQGRKLRRGVCRRHRSSIPIALHWSRLRRKLRECKQTLSGSAERRWSCLGSLWAQAAKSQEALIWMQRSVMHSMTTVAASRAHQDELALQVSNDCWRVRKNFEISISWRCVREQGLVVHVLRPVVERLHLHWDWQSESQSKLSQVLYDIIIYAIRLLRQRIPTKEFVCQINCGPCAAFEAPNVLWSLVSCFEVNVHDLQMLTCALCFMIGELCLIARFPFDLVFCSHSISCHVLYVWLGIRLIESALDWGQSYTKIASSQAVGFLQIQLNSLCFLLCTRYDLWTRTPSIFRIYCEDAIDIRANFLVPWWTYSNVDFHVKEPALLQQGAVGVLWAPWDSLQSIVKQYCVSFALGLTVRSSLIIAFTVQLHMPPVSKHILLAIFSEKTVLYRLFWSSQCLIPSLPQKLFFKQSMSIPIDTANHMSVVVVFESHQESFPCLANL